MYYVNYDCSNCGKDSRIGFPMGTAAPSVTTCLHCGVHSANKAVTWGKTAPPSRCEYRPTPIAPKDIARWW